VPTTKHSQQRDAEELLTTVEVADLLGQKDRKGVLRLIASGHLTPAMKLRGATGAYLFNRSDVLTYITARRSQLQSELDRIGRAG
jgi:excisionase family DNA binding protein